MKPAKKIPDMTLKSFDRPMRDYWGEKIPRRVRIGKMGAQLKAMTYDNPEGRRFLRALEKSAGFTGEKIKRISVELYQEGLTQWVLEVQAVAGRQRRTLCLTISKDIGNCSKVARREWELLKVLHERNPKAVVRVMEGISVPLPGKRQDGELFGYFSQWLGASYTELGIDERHRFALVGQEKVHSFTPEQSDGVRGQILECLASLYDPTDRSAAVDVEVNSGDFMGRVRGNAVEVKLIAVRRLRSGFSPTGLLRHLFAPKGSHAGKEFFVLPSDAALAAAHLLAGFEKSLGSREAAHSFARKGVRQAIRKSEFFPAPFLSWKELLEFV
jgi:hypothetical protein